MSRWRASTSSSELGVQLAIDDFGTGYSSLSYLRAVPRGHPQDRQIVRRRARTTGDKARPLVRAIVELARALNLQTVAEGIEDVSQLSALQLLGCDYGQGYFYARPLDDEAATRYIVEHRTSPSNHPDIPVAESAA